MDKHDLRARAADIELLITDIDGVLTDGRIWMLPDGQEMKVFHARDGHGIKLLTRAGIEVAVISGRSSPLVEKRMKGLGVRHIFQGREDKLPVFDELLAELNLQPDQVAYIGDDSLDVPPMGNCGLPCSVADGHPSARAAALWISSLPGGQGAVRELCDFIIGAKNGRDRA